MSDCLLSNFDFKKYTVIGVQGTSSGHFQPIVDLQVLKNDRDKLFIIDVTISGGKLCEACKVNRPFYRRVIYTEKLNPEYTIEFNYVKIDG